MCRLVMEWCTRGPCHGTLRAFQRYARGIIALVITVCGAWAAWGSGNPPIPDDALGALKNSDLAVETLDKT